MTDDERTVEVTVTFRCKVSQIAAAPRAAVVLVDALRDDWTGGQVGGLQITDVFAPSGVRIVDPWKC